MKLLKFYADWCAPCKMLTQAMEGMELPFEVEEVNIDENPSMALQYGIRGIPTVVLLNDQNEEIERMSDSSKIKQYLIEQSNKT